MSRLCFFLSTTGVRPDDVARSNLLLDRVVRPACDATGYTVVRAGLDSAGDSISAEILESFQRADVVVADGARQYEATITALRVRVPRRLVVELARTTRTPQPRDRRTLRTIFYDESIGALTTAATALTDFLASLDLGTLPPQSAAMHVPNVRPWRERRIQKYHRNLAQICELAESYGIKVSVPDGWHHVQFRYLNYIGNYYPSTRSFFLQAPKLLPTEHGVSPEKSLLIFLKHAVRVEAPPYNIFLSSWAFRDFYSVPKDVERVGEYLVPWLRSEILRLGAYRPEAIDQVAPIEFEHLIATLLRHGGYEANVTPASGDGGKDIVAIRDRDGKQFVLLVECKRWLSENVGIDIVQRVVGVRHLDCADHAMIVTTAHFTQPALHESRRAANELTLVDRQALTRWLRSYEKSMRLGPG